MNHAAICLKIVLTLLSNAHKYLTQYIIEVKPVQQSKQTIKFELNKIESVINDLIMLANPEHAKIIRNEVIDNWETLSIQNVLGMMVQLTDEEKRRVEEFTEKILNKEI